MYGNHRSKTFSSGPKQIMMNDVVNGFKLCGFFKL